MKKEFNSLPSTIQNELNCAQLTQNEEKKSTIIESLKTNIPQDMDISSSNNKQQKFVDIKLKFGKLHFWPFFS